MPTTRPETLEIDAQGREGLVLDVALPVLAAWSRSVRVTGFRPTMGVSGLSPQEVARLRTLGLATGARATGLFEGANDFRMGFGAAPASQSSFGVEADLAGHPVAPVISDLLIAAFGLPEGRTMNHRLRGLTHQRGSSAQGHTARTLRSLGSELGLDLDVRFLELGFEPQGLGEVTISASRRGSKAGSRVDWRDRGELRGVHVTLGGVRPRAEQLERVEAAFREAWWEARRVEPVVERLVTAGVDPGSFVQLDLEFERGGASFLDVMSRSTSPLTQARRASRRAQSCLDSSATCDELTGIEVIGAAAAARTSLELSLVPSPRISAACSLLGDIGAEISTEEAPGLVILKTPAL